jgi:acetolactate synthase-1/2/3 large subunit
MKASDLFVRCLEAEGVHEIYGVPGEENADFMISLEDSPIEFILCRHEQGAAFMAEVVGRLRGAPGVCLGTLGPGATNLITGVADGNMDRSPMVVLTGQADSKRQHKESHQAMDVVAMFRPVTKWAQPVRHADSIPEVVRKAFQLAQEEKPGACHVELAEDIAEVETEAKPLVPVRARRPFRTINRSIGSSMPCATRSARSSSPAMARSARVPAPSCAAS